MYGPSESRDHATGPDAGAQDALRGGHTAPFDIHIDHERHLLEMTLRGEWDAAVCAAFATAYRQATEALNTTGGIAYSLVDASGYGELTQDVAELFPPLAMATNPSTRRRTALVSTALVNKVQSRELVEMLNARYFRTVESAREWLFSDEA